MPSDAWSGVPVGPVPVPDAVRALAGESTITPVWCNELGGLTFRLDDPRGSTIYVKWVAAGTPEIDLSGEAVRLAWARPWAPVPTVLEQGCGRPGRVAGHRRAARQFRRRRAVGQSA